MISVITASLPERGHLLASAAVSIARQTLPPAAWYLEIDHARRGPAPVLNRLAERVDTPWLFRLDDDDVLERDHFETIRPYLRDDQADVVYTYTAVEGRIARNRYQIPFDAQRLATENYIPSAAAIRTDLWRELGGLRTDDNLERTRHEDWDLWLRALDLGARFICIPIVTWRYRLGDWNHRSL